MNKVILNGIELEDAVIVINTNEKPQTNADPVPPSGGGPGEEHKPA